MAEGSVITQVIDRLSSGVAKLIDTITGDIFTLFRLIILLAISFIVGWLISATRAPESIREERVYDPIEEFLKKVVGSEVAPDTVNLAIMSSAFDLVNNLVRLIEAVDIVEKEHYFPKPAIERFKGLIADIQIKIDEFRRRYNIDDDYRRNIREIIDSATTEYCTKVLRLEMPSQYAKPTVSPEELKRTKTKEEFEKMFGELEEGEKEEKGSIEKFLQEIADIVESHGI